MKPLLCMAGTVPGAKDTPHGAYTVVREEKNEQQIHVARQQ